MHGLEHGDEALDVGLDVGERVLERVANARLGGEVDHVRDLPLAQQQLKQRRVAHVAFDELELRAALVARRAQQARALALEADVVVVIEVVETDHRVPARVQLERRVEAHESRRTCEQHALPRGRAQFLAKLRDDARVRLLRVVLDRGSRRVGARVQHGQPDAQGAEAEEARKACAHRHHRESRHGVRLGGRAPAPMR